MDSKEKHEAQVEQFNDCLEWLDDHYSDKEWWAQDRSTFIRQTQPVMGVECPEREAAMIALYSLMSGANDNKEQYQDFVTVRNALLKLEV